MSRPRIAVIGAGHLGKIHLRLLRTRTDVELVGLVEPVAAAREAVAREFSVAAWSDVADVIGHIDAAIVATPTRTHHSVGVALARQGIHLFVEKPIAATVVEADELVSAARSTGVVLQVGHVERFNPAFTAARPHLSQVRYVEAVRASGYTFRSTDIGVVFDLMIHDLDMILSLIRAPLVRVDAVGLTLFGPHEDLAQARLEFANGCVANLSASRASLQPQRTMHVFTHRACAMLDFATGTAQIVRPREDLLRGELDVHQLPTAEKEHLRHHLFDDMLRLEALSVEPRNAIQDEHQDFMESIRTGGSPRVSGTDASFALGVAEAIVAAVARHQWSDDSHAPTRPLLRPPPWLTGVPGRQHRKAG